MPKFFYHILFLSLFAHLGSAQGTLLHEDPEMYKAIREGTTFLYNFEFEKAQIHFLQIKKKYPAHPAYSFSQALILFTKNFPIKQGHADYQKFNYFVNDCLKKSDVLLKQHPNNADGIFFSLTANSYLALMHSLSKDYLGAISSAKKVYSFMKQGFALKKSFPDFYYTSGLFYYYAEQYPETHPMVKPLMVFFENGNRAQGFLELNVAMLKGIYTQQEAEILLSYLYLKYENKPAKSLEYSERFYYNYSNNPMALAKYIEGLLLTEDYDKAKELLPKLTVTQSEFFKMVAELFAAMLEEKRSKRLEVAKAQYTKVLQLLTASVYKTDDQQSFCYLGLGRIAEAQGDRKKAFTYYKKALEITEYEGVKKECSERLNSEARSLQVH